MYLYKLCPDFKVKKSEHKVSGKLSQKISLLKLKQTKLLVGTFPKKGIYQIFKHFQFNFHIFTQNVM